MWYSCGDFSCRNWLYHVRSIKQEKIGFILNSAFRKSIGCRKLLFYLLSLAFLPAKSQNDSLAEAQPSFSTGLNAHYGFIIPHSESIRSISYSNPRALEINFAWHYSDPVSQSYCNCFPRIGVAAMYISFNNNAILGHGISLTPFVEPFILLGRRINLSFRFLAGAVYLNNVYDPVTNPDNLFYSTKFSYLLSIDPVLNFQLHKNWNLRISGNYNHISNGGNTHPNKGINFPTFSAGFDYINKPVDFSRKLKTEETHLTYKNSFRIVLLGTLKLPFGELHKRKILYGGNFIFGRTVSRLSRLTTGIEYVNDGALKTELKKQTATPPDHRRVSALAGHDLMIGRFIFSQQLGVYLYSPAKAMDPVFQRWGLDYYISKKFLFGVNLKAHRHVADFLDFRVTCVL